MKLGLRARIILALVGISSPLVLFALLNQVTVTSILRNSSTVGETSVPLLRELLRIEGTVEEIALDAQKDEGFLAAQSHVWITELQTSLSIIESLEAVYARPMRFELDHLAACVRHLVRIVSACREGCFERREEIEKEHTSIDRRVEVFLNEEVSRVALGNQQLRARMEKAQKSRGLLLVLLLAVLGTAGSILASRISAQLTALERAVRGFMAGESNVTLPPPTGDEVGKLVRAFQALLTTLNDTTVTRAYLEALLESMGEGVVVTDEKGRIITANPLASQLLSATLPVNTGEIFPPPALDGWRRAGAGVDALVEGRSSAELFLHVTCAVLKGPQGALTGFVYGLRDVTEKRVLERALAEQRERVMRSERITALGTLGAIVAHKLSQPLSSVKLFVQQARRTLAAGTVDQVASEPLENALTELARITDAVKQMMLSSKESSESTSRAKYVDVKEVVTSLLESLAPQANSRNAALRCILPEQEVVASCPPTECEEVVYSLLNNSLQAADGEKSVVITVTVSISQQHVHISVSDTCSGIPEENLDSLFECFFTTKPEGQGTGLGLAIVRHIAERHGGSVTVKSVEGEGASFTVAFPEVKLSEVRGAADETEPSLHS